MMNVRVPKLQNIFISLGTSTPNNMHITTCKEPDHNSKLALLDLWNAEYATELALATVAGLEQYLDKLNGKQHWFLSDDDGRIQGWLLLFERDGETWFAILMQRAVQGKGYGRQLMGHAQQAAPGLNGWVIDREIYRKADGSVYPVPLDFYRKLGFEVLEDVRLEDKISAVKIRWRKPL